MANGEQRDIERTTTDTTGGWVGLLRTVLTTAGPVAFIATLLAVFLGAAVWGRLDRIEQNQGKILGTMTAAQGSMGAFVSQHQEIERERSLLLQSQINLLRQLCVNSAKNDYQTRGCLTDGSVR